MGGGVRAESEKTRIEVTISLHRNYLLTVSVRNSTSPAQHRVFHTAGFRGETDRELS